MEDGIVATHDERVLIEAIKSGSNGVEVAKRFDSFASSWKDKFHLEALAKCSDELVKACGKENAGIEALCSFCFKLANRGEKTLFSAVFGSELMRSLLLSSMESGVGRKDASGAFVRLCLFCLKDKSVDVVVASFVRFLVIPVRRLLQDRASDLQSLANAAQIVAARCASQSFDKMREPDEVVLFAEAGVFDELGARLEIEALHGPIMNAIQGLMTSPAALEKVDPKGKMMERLKILRSSNKQASSIVDAVELVDFKRVVKEKAKEKGGQALGNEFLGVLGAAGFHFGERSVCFKKKHSQEVRSSLASSLQIRTSKRDSKIWLSKRVC
jgi:hypothetical protein